VQGLQWFLSESTWDAEQVNHHRLGCCSAALRPAPATRGVLVIDDTGDRNDGSHTTGEELTDGDRTHLEGCRPA